MPSSPPSSRKPKKPGKKPTQKPKKKLLDLIREYRQKRAIGARFYGQSDEVLELILPILKVGRKIPLGNQLTAVLVDAFGEGKTKIFKPVFVNRYELQVLDATGKPCRLRDAKAKPAKGKAKKVKAKGR